MEYTKEGMPAVPAGWAFARIADVLNLQNGFAFKPTQWKTAGIPIIRIQNLNDRGATFNFCTDELPDKFRVDPGDLLFAWSGTPGTSFGAHIWSGPRAWLNQHIFRVGFDDALFDKRFLRLAINRNLDDYIRQAHGGAGLAHITKGKFEASQLLLAPLAEQKRIVAKVEEVLARANAARERLTKMPTILRRFRQSVLAAACSGRLTADWRDQRSFTSEMTESEDGITYPAHWTYRLTAELVEPGTVISYGIVLPGPNLPKGVPYIRGQDIDDAGQINVPQLWRTSPEIANKHARSALCAGDVLLCVIRHLRVAVVPPGIDGANLTQGTVRMRPGCGISNNYLALYLRSPQAQNWMKSKYVGSDMPRINVEHARTIPVPVPPREEQAEIASRVETLFKWADQIDRRLATATAQTDRLVQSVLTKAFQGELVPTEAELAARVGHQYESAEALLERIQQQRAFESGLAAPSKSKKQPSGASSREADFKETLFETGAVPRSRIGKPAEPTRTSPTTSGLSRRSNGSQNSSDAWVEISYDEAMAVVREAFAEGGARDREHAIRDVAVALGYKRVGSRVRDTVDGYLRAAIRRGILFKDGGSYNLVERSAGDYERDHLIDSLIASMNGGWTARDEAVRATARHLGFQKAGVAFKDGMRSAINGAIRRGLLEYDGDMIRKK